MARSVVLIVRHRGGHFLRRDEKSGRLYEVGDEKAEAKTSQALREGLDVRATKTAANTLMCGHGDKEGGRKKNAAAITAGGGASDGAIVVTSPMVGVKTERAMQAHQLQPIHAPGYGPPLSRPARPPPQAAAAAAGYYPPYPPQRYDDPYYRSRYHHPPTANAAAAAAATAGYEYGVPIHPRHLQQPSSPHHPHQPPTMHHHHVHHYAAAAAAGGGYHYPTGYNVGGYPGGYPGGGSGGAYPSPPRSSPVNRKGLAAKTGVDAASNVTPIVSRPHCPKPIHP